MSDKPVRIRWTVALWGERAADDPSHSISGSGETPTEAMADLQERLKAKADLLGSFKSAIPPDYAESAE